MNNGKKRRRKTCKEALLMELGYDDNPCITLSNNIIYPLYFALYIETKRARLLMASKCSCFFIPLFWFYFISII